MHDSLNGSLNGDLNAENLKRSRTHIACELCRRRKIRCDSELPACSNCVRSNATCVYPEDGRRKRRMHTPDPETSLTSRLERVEQLLQNVCVMLQDRLQGGASGGAAPATSPETPSTHSLGARTPGTHTPSISSTGAHTPSITPSIHTPGSAGAGTPVGAGDTGGTSEKKSMDAYRPVIPTAMPSALLSTLPHSFQPLQPDPPAQHENEDLLQLSDRRSPVVIKLGDGEPLVTYTHGFTNSLLNPALMRRLCSRIGSDALGRAAEERLTMLWRHKMCHALRERIGSVKDVQLDGKVIEACVRQQQRTTSNIDLLLCDTKDCTLVNQMCCPQQDFGQIDFESPYALLYLIAVVQYASAENPEMPKEFGAEHLAAQSSAAMRLCLQMFVPTAHCTFLLLRLHVYAIYAMYRRMHFPHLRSLVAVALSMARDLGLHRGDGSRLLTPGERRRRALVWIMVKDLDVKLSCSVACVPQTSFEEWPLGELDGLRCDGLPDVRALLIASQLNTIYVDMCNSIFSPPAKHLSVKQLMDNLCVIVNRLNFWWEDLPNSAKVFMQRVEREEEQALKVELPNERLYDWGEHWTHTPESTKKQFLTNALLQYFLMIQLVHSIPAFSPSCLRVYEEVPPVLAHSLDILNQASLQTLRLSFHREGLRSVAYLLLTATNAFSALFLKQIRDIHHPTNKSDLDVICRYIRRFARMASKPLSTSYLNYELVCSLWSMFADILAQLQQLAVPVPVSDPPPPLWDTFSEFNMVELDGPPFGTDLEQDVNNCVVS